jgi:hypothetical protein
VRRIQPTGLATQVQIDMGIAALEQADVSRSAETMSSPKGGRPQRMYSVNPLIYSEEQRTHRPLGSPGPN